MLQDLIELRAFGDRPREMATAPNACDGLLIDRSGHATRLGLSLLIGGDIKPGRISGTGAGVHRSARPGGAFEFLQKLVGIRFAIAPKGIDVARACPVVAASSARGALATQIGRAHV